MLAGLATGCVNTVDDRSQLGVPFIRDKVEGNYQFSVPRVVEAAKAVIKHNGALTADNTINNSLEGQINKVTVLVRVEEVDPAKPITRVQVETRTRLGGTDIDLAHEIEKEIALQLAGR